MGLVAQDNHGYASLGVYRRELLSNLPDWTRVRNPWQVAIRFRQQSVLYGAAIGRQHLPTVGIDMKPNIKLARCIIMATALAAGTASAGTITVYTALEDQEVTSYIKGFEQTHPDIHVNALRLSTGNLSARIIAEEKHPRADVIWGQAVTDLMDPKIYDQLEPYHEKGLDKIPAKFKDPAGRWVAATGYVAAFCVNTKLLKEKHLPMPTSWKDLTNPVYKGQVVMPSPASSGTGYLQVEPFVQSWGMDKGFAFVKKLNANVAQYTNGGSPPCKMARVGQFAIGASFAFVGVQSIAQGYPIKLVMPHKFLGYELEGSGLVKTSQHKKDAKVFLDWILTPQANKLYEEQSKSIVSLPNHHYSQAQIKAGLPTNLNDLLYDVNFKWSAAHRLQIVKKWQEVTHG